MKEFACYNEQKNKIDAFGQWDINQTVYMHNLVANHTPIAHIFNCDSEDAYAVEIQQTGNIWSTKIPNELLEENKGIYVVIYDYDLTEKSGLTTYCSMIPVKKKPKPKDYVPQETVDVSLVAFISDAKKQINDELAGLKKEVDKTLSDLKKQVGDSISDLTDKINDEVDKIPDTVKAEMKKYDISSNTVKFTTPSTFSTINSGETLATLFGKVKAFMDDEITKTDIDNILS